MKSTSNKAFTSNLKAEMHAGKPQRQALAIAYAVKRRAQHKAHGGKVMEYSAHGEDCTCPKCMMAEGGEVLGKAQNPHMEPGHIAHAIRMKRQSIPHYSQGGLVDDDEDMLEDLDHMREEEPTEASLHMTDTYPTSGNEESDTMAQDQGEDKKRKRLRMIFGYDR